MSEQRPESASEWTDYYLARDEWEATDAVDNKNMSGDQLKGAWKALQVRADNRHGEAMLAAATANKYAKAALAVSIGSLILALIAIIQGCQTA